MVAFDSTGPRKRAGLNGSSGPAEAGLLEALAIPKAAPGRFIDEAAVEVAMSPAEKARMSGEMRAAGASDEEIWSAVGLDPVETRQKSDQREAQRAQRARANLITKAQMKGLSKREINRILEAQGMETLGWFD